MYCKLININSPAVFKKYSKSYNIFRDLYEVFSFGLEIFGLLYSQAEEIHKLLLGNGDICFKQSLRENSAKIFTIGPFDNLRKIAGLIRSKINEEIGHSIDQALKNYELYDTNTVKIGDSFYPLDRIYILGILNVTPDSFSDGGKYSEVNEAVNHAINMFNNGADIIDIGGESTRPGSKPVIVDEELSRVIPVIERIKDKIPEIVISIDTTKAEVAAKAIQSGATIVNDISGLTFDVNMADVIAEYDSAAILMHMKGKPENMQDNPIYEDVLDEVYEFLNNRIKFAKKKNIDNIIIDPGFGFGKRLNDNYEILNRMNEFKSLGCPILAGISRKSMLGKALNLEVNNREPASLVAETISAYNGARFIRTHNVENAYHLKQIFSFINNPEILADV